MLEFVEWKVGQSENVEWDCTLKGVSVLQSSCLLNCQCLKPNLCTETDDLTSKQLSHSNWPGVQRWESWQAYFSFSHVPSPFMCTTECKLRMNAFKERSSKSVRHFFFFFTVQCVDTAKTRESHRALGERSGRKCDAAKTRLWWQDFASPLSAAAIWSMYKHLLFHKNHPIQPLLCLADLFSLPYRKRYNCFSA